MYKSLAYSSYGYFLLLLLVLQSFSHKAIIHYLKDEY